MRRLGAVMTVIDFAALLVFGVGLGVVWVVAVGILIYSLANVDKIADGDLYLISTNGGVD